LEACNTDWLKWNYQGEDVKTAKVYRSEREAKSAGNVILRESVGKGELIVSTLDLFVLGNQSKGMIQNMIANLGGSFEGEVKALPDALNENMILVNALFLGSFKNESGDINQVFKHDPISESEFTKVKMGTKTNGLYWELASANEVGVFDIEKMNIKDKKNSVAYLSFWIYSPRSLTDLLIEPNMPRLDMHFGMDDALAFSINGKLIKEYLRTGPLVEDSFNFDGLPLEKGWNHMLIKVGQGAGRWAAKIRFSCNQEDFLKGLKTTVDR
jgi:hypothetical protein